MGHRQSGEHPSLRGYVVTPFSIPTPMRFPLLLLSSLVLSTPAFATPHPSYTAEGGDASSTSTSNSSNTVNSRTQHAPIPDIPGPVPRGYVPVLSLYSQYDQRGPVFGAQVSIPLAR